MSTLQDVIEAAWENRATLSPSSTNASVRDAVDAVLAKLDRGELRVAEKIDGAWHTHQWIKKAVLLSFRLSDNVIMKSGELGFYDKVPTKFAHVTEDEMKLKAVQETLIENLVKRKVDVKCLEAKETQMAAHGMVQKEIAIKEGIDTDNARAIVRMIKGQNLKVQAAIQEKQVRVSGKNRDDLQKVIALLKDKELGIAVQFTNYRTV